MTGDLKLFVLGSPQVLLGEQSISSSLTPKALSLLSYLAVNQRSYTREMIANFLWQEATEQQARNNLRYLLPELRTHLAPYLHITRQSISFNHQSDYWLDLAVLQAAVNTPVTAVNVTDLKAAVALYKGEFLEGFHVRNTPAFSHWLTTQREELHLLVIRGLLTLATYYQHQADYTSGLQMTQQILKLEPWHEVAHYQQMQLLIASDRPQSAQAQYQLYRQVLADELMLPPSPEISALYETLLNRSVVAKNQPAHPLSPDESQSIQASTQHNPDLPIYQPTAYAAANPETLGLSDTIGMTSANWSAIPIAHKLYGRAKELTQLTRWLVEEKCRVVGVLGMGGQGKTILVARLIRDLAANHPPEKGLATGQPDLQAAPSAQPFTVILWASLLNTPPLHEVLQDWLQWLSGHQLTTLPVTFEQQVALLLQYTQQHRCLLVLDNLESILQGGEQVGTYYPGYENYGELLRRFSENNHQSCLVFTSRELPNGIDPLQSDKTRVRALLLKGLSREAGASIFQAQGLASHHEGVTTLIQRYSGNPLALTLITETIWELFNGDIAAFAQEESFIFGDIRHVLAQQVDRLSLLEQSVLFWLAIEREPVTLAALRSNFIQPSTQRLVLETIRSLLRRSLVEKQPTGFTLQNVVMEYATDLLVQTIYQEIEAAPWLETEQHKHPPLALEPQEASTLAEATHANQIVQSHLNRFALIKAQSKAYVRTIQERMVLKPVAEQLVSKWGTLVLASHIQRMLDTLRRVAPRAPGYAGANLLHLLATAGIDIRGYNFSQLALWQADLRKVDLTNVNCKQADLTNAAFTEPMDVISALCFSADSQHLIAGSTGGDIYIWRCADHQLEHQFQGHVGPIYSLALSPDQQLLASASGDQTVRVWHVATGELACTLSGHDNEVILVAFDETGQTLISMGEDGITRSWQAAIWQTKDVYDQPYAIWGGTDHPVYRAAASADGSWTAGGSDDSGLVYCWHVQSSRLVAKFRGHAERILNLAITDDGKTLASSSLDGTIRLWTIPDSADSLDTDQASHVFTEPAEQLIFSPDSALLISGFQQQICLWDLKYGKLRQRLSSHASKMSALAISPDGSTLASASYDQTISLWQLPSGQVEYKLYGQAKAVEFVQFTLDGTRLINSSFNHTLHLWTKEGIHLHTLRGHNDPARKMACSPDGIIVATGGHDGSIYLWNLHTGVHTYTVHPNAGNVNALAFQPSTDGKRARLVSAGDDARIYLWNAQTGESLGHIQGHTSQLKSGQIKSIVFNPSGTLLASGSADHTISIWDMGPTEPFVVGKRPLRHHLQGHYGMVRTVAFHPNGRLVASSSDDRQIGLWDAVDGRLCQFLQGHTKPVLTAQFSLDGRTLVSGSQDQTICIWAIDADRQYATLRHRLTESIYKYNCIALSPDNRTLVSGSIDTMVRIWDLHTGQLCHTLAGHTNLVTSVDISLDGQIIASSSIDGTVRLWDTQTGRCLHSLQPQGPYTGMQIHGATGITDAQKTALTLLGAIDQ